VSGCTNIRSTSTLGKKHHLPLMAPPRPHSVPPHQMPPHLRFILSRIARVLEAQSRPVMLLRQTGSPRSAPPHQPSPMLCRFLPKTCARSFLKPKGKFWGWNSKPKTKFWGRGRVTLSIRIRESVSRPGRQAWVFSSNRRTVFQCRLWPPCACWASSWLTFSSDR